MQFFSNRYSVFIATLMVIATAHASRADDLTLHTGPKIGTYIAIGQDISTLAKLSDMDISVESSNGSIANIQAISAHGDALGIVQSDVLGFIQRSDNPRTKEVASHLRMVLPLYKEEVHLLVRRDIESISDLKGRNLVVGTEGSGNMLTATNLLALMDIKVSDTQRLKPAEGVLAVLEGSADGVLFVGGKPVKLFQNIENLADPEYAKYKPLLENVHFLPLDMPEMLEEYAVGTLTPADYNFIEKPVSTIAVQAILVTYEDPRMTGLDAQEKCRQLATLTETIEKGIGKLRKNGHPKWQEIDFKSPSPKWKKDRCSWPK